MYASNPTTFAAVVHKAVDKISLSPADVQVPAVRMINWWSHAASPHTHTEWFDELTANGPPVNVHAGCWWQYRCSAGPPYSLVVMTLQNPEQSTEALVSEEYRHAQVCVALRVPL